MVSVSSNLFRLKGNAFWQGLANYVYRSDISLLHLLLCSLVDETEANFYWVIISIFKSIRIKRFFKNLNMLWSYIYILREDWILFNSDLIAVILDDSCYLLAMSPRCDPRCIQLSATSHCTMCCLLNRNSSGLLAPGDILKNPQKYVGKRHFFSKLTTRRKIEKNQFLWVSNSNLAEIS